MDITNLILQLAKTFLILFIGLLYNEVLSMPTKTNHSLQKLQANRGIQTLARSKRSSAWRSESSLAQALAQSVVQDTEQQPVIKRYRRLYCKYYKLLRIIKMSIAVFDSLVAYTLT